MLRKMIALGLLLLTSVAMRGQNSGIDSTAVWNRLLENTELANTLDALGREVKAQVLEQMPLLSKVTVGELDDSIRTIGRQYLDEHVMPLLKQHFTLDDAIEINAFYQTVAGSKLKEVQQGLSTQMTNNLHQYSTRLNQAVTEILQRAANTPSGQPDN